MTQTPFVSTDFEPPTSLVTDHFRLEPLGPQHNESDLKAWTSSIDHIRSTPGYPDGRWPPVTGMTPEENRSDLERHAADFVARKGFTFTVLDSEGGEVIGCVYMYPSTDPQFDVHIQSWVSAARSHLDQPLADAVAEWVGEAWPWERVMYR